MSAIRSAIRAAIRPAVRSVFGGAAAIESAPAILAPANQTIFTVSTANTITLASNADVHADGVSIGSATPSLSWTPGAVDLDVDLTSVVGAAESSPTKVAVAAANGVSQDLTGWTKTSVTVTSGQTDADGGTSAYLLTAASGTGNRLINKSPSPAMVNQETSWEWIVKAGTHSKIALYDAGTNNQVAYLDLSTGEANCNRLSAKVVEDLGGGWKRIWAKANGDGAEVTKLNTMRLYLCGSLTGLSLTAAGTETVYAYRPRSVDGPLPLTNYQKCGFRRNGTTAYGAERWTITTPFNRNVADMAQTTLYLDVLKPDTYSASNSYKVVYLMPVEGTPTSYADELSVVDSLDLHNSMDCLFVRPTFFQTRTWGGTKTDGTRNHDAFISEMMVGFMDEFYSTTATRNSRCIVGYSAGGFAALAQFQRSPTVWGYCIAWDVPLTVAYGSYDEADHFGSEAQYNAYNPYQQLASTKTGYNDACRLIFGGGSIFNSSTSSMFSSLVSELGASKNGTDDYDTDITDASGKWWRLYKDVSGTAPTSHNFTSDWATPAFAALENLW